MSDTFKPLRLTETRTRIDQTSSMPVALAFQNNTLRTVLYTPRGDDRQQPHDEDEIYVVATGSAVLEVDGNREHLVAGDAAFVAAHARHAFVEMSNDFAVWAVFPLAP